MIQPMQKLSSGFMRDYDVREDELPPLMAALFLKPLDDAMAEMVESGACFICRLTLSGWVESHPKQENYYNTCKVKPLERYLTCTVLIAWNSSCEKCQLLFGAYEACRIRDLLYSFYG